MVKRNPSLVDQVKQELLAAIYSGVLADGSGRLPSEDKLSIKYNVSRSTIREAISQLVLAGVIVRRHGVGNFLRESNGETPDRFWGWLEISSSFSDYICMMNMTPECKLINVETRQAGSLALNLKVPPTSTIVFFDRLFLGDKIPIIYSETSVSSLFLKESDFNDPELSKKMDSIYYIFEEHHNIHVNHQTCEIRAACADESIKKIFNCSTDLPLLRLEEVGYSKSEKPLFHAVNYFRGDMVSFSQLRWPSEGIILQGKE